LEKNSEECNGLLAWQEAHSRSHEKIIRSESFYLTDRKREITRSESPAKPVKLTNPYTTFSLNSSKSAKKKTRPDSVKYTDSIPLTASEKPALCSTKKPYLLLIRVFFPFTPKSEEKKSTPYTRQKVFLLRKQESNPMNSK